MAEESHNPFADLGGHALAMGVFGGVGYFVHQWDKRAAQLLAEKRAEIAAARQGAGAEAE